MLSLHRSRFLIRACNLIAAAGKLDSSQLSLVRKSNNLVQCVPAPWASTIVQALRFDRCAKV